MQGGPFAGLTIDQLQTKAEGLINALAYLADRQTDRSNEDAAEAQRVRAEFVGARPG